MARLLFLTGTSPGVRAGSGTYVGISVLRDALVALGHTVEIMAPVPTHRPVSLARRLLFNVRARWGAARVLAKPDAIVGFDLDGFLLPASGARRVVSVKGVLAEEARFEHGVPRVRLTIESFLERLHVGRADRVIATSVHSATRIARDYGIAADRIAVVPEPIDLARWRGALEKAPKLPRQSGSILCVAHLYPRKDVATLLAAMTQLSSAAVLRVVGIGPELARLERLAQELKVGGKVEFLRHVSFERLAGEYRRADVFCLPSRQEGFGIVFLEAMAAGLPIVAARAAAVPEVVADGESGILVPPGSADKLTAALDHLLRESGERRRMGEAGRRRVERYDAPLIGREFLGAIGFA